MFIPLLKTTVGHPAENGIVFGVFVAAKPTRVRTFQAVAFPWFNPRKRAGKLADAPANATVF